jgi:2',3'-cyclic-nucleotide 2'-phosphodiesterase
LPGFLPREAFIVKVLFVGDIVGNSGRDALKEFLPVLKGRYDWDICIANAENAAGGKGLTEAVAHDLLDLGIELMTMGNHTWDNKDIFNFIESASWLTRPFNYPPGTPGQGYLIREIAGKRLALLNLSGQVFMGPLDCPFAAADEALKQLQDCDYILVDIHAEATSEKLTMAYYLDGRVSAVLGTHTHIQTADERLLPGGTMYITDVGMTGARESILGMEIKPIMERFVTKMPRRFKSAGGLGQINAVWLDLEKRILKRIWLTQD